MIMKLLTEPSYQFYSSSSSQCRGEAEVYISEKVKTRSFIENRTKSRFIQAKWILFLSFVPGRLSMWVFMRLFYKTRSENEISLYWHSKNRQPIGVAGKRCVFFALPVNVNKSGNLSLTAFRHTKKIGLPFRLCVWLFSIALCQRRFFSYSTSPPLFSYALFLLDKT